MSYDRPIVLSIAGFDPSGGAGILADIKTFEQHRCLGMAIPTANTLQTEDAFYSVEWKTIDGIVTAYRTMAAQYTFPYIKIGLMQNLELLYVLLSEIKKIHADSLIVWDPIVKASAGKVFMEYISPLRLQKVLGYIDIVTPNIPEVIALSGLSSEDEAALYLSKYCHVLLKGGHCEQDKGTDRLWKKNAMEAIKLYSEVKVTPTKHGTGCILSASILSNLALGHDLETACRLSKKYIERSLLSNSLKLAYHVI